MVKKRTTRKDIHQFRKLTQRGFKSEWPSRTDVSCWWCCHGFESVPVGVPVRYEEATKTYHLHGVFCGFGCAKAYNMSRSHAARPVRAHLLSRMQRDVYGVHEDVPAAPPFQELEQFGGDMTLEQFRGATVETRVLEPMLVPAFVEVEDATAPPRPVDVTQAGKYIPEQPLKLRRTRPLPGRRHSLDSFMEITTKTPS